MLNFLSNLKFSTKMDRQNSKIELSPAGCCYPCHSSAAGREAAVKPPMTISLAIIVGSSKYVILGFTVHK